MPINPIAPVTRATQVSRFVARHTEVLLFATGALFGFLATAGAVLVGGIR
jgi:hypothetical protein